MIAKHGIQTGRVVVFELDHLSEVSAEEFLSYINEGFVPVLYETPNIVTMDFDVSGKYTPLIWLRALVDNSIHLYLDEDAQNYTATAIAILESELSGTEDGGEVTGK